MNIQELATARECGAPVKIAILNNNYLGMVRQWQELFYNGHYASTVMEVTPDFVALAQAYGAVGLRARTKAEVEPVIREALAAKNVVIMDFPSTARRACSRWCRRARRPPRCCSSKARPARQPAAGLAGGRALTDNPTSNRTLHP
jgi:acetolactate synthase, large subunit (EC 2.2.1.6)